MKLLVATLLVGAALARPPMPEGPQNHGFPFFPPGAFNLIPGGPPGGPPFFGGIRPPPPFLKVQL